MPDGFGRALNVADRLLAPFEWLMTFTGGFLIFALMFWGMVQIVLRTVFDSPIFGYIDWVVFFMIGFCLFGMSWMQRTGGHVRMELLLGKLSGRPYWMLELIGSLLAAFIVAVLIPYAYQHFERAFPDGDSTIDLELVTWPGKLAVPVALGILLLRILIQTFGYLRMLLRPDLVPVAVPHIKSVEEQANEEIEAAR